MTQEKPRDGGKNLRSTDDESTFHYISPIRGDILKDYSCCRTITVGNTMKSNVKYKCFLRIMSVIACIFLVCSV